ncbi:FHA domain-containing protein [Luethyella okanaganae]|uniref:FHA domain-containing protein n=1 Tax=Luethyella okanaganae TaxID=69372 RepID=A0ABW1VCL9_9MICO
MDNRDFIVPPPGLIPQHKGEPAPAASVVRPATFPVFHPVAAGPATAAPVLPPAHASVPGPWRLVLPDGVEIEVTGSLVLGRDPGAVETRPHAELRALDDPSRSVSKTHLLVDLEGGELSVLDLHSTNGVVVVGVDGSETELEPGSRWVVRSGDTLKLGEFSFRVVRDGRR